MPLQQAAPYVTDTHQRQRRDEVLRELSIGSPRLARAVAGEGQRIDEDWLRTTEPNVEGAGIAKHEAARQARSWMSSVSSAASFNAPKAIPRDTR